ncbi:MAG: BamA/TamA family outer membrane protein [Acidobacteria bacterium]|nr:BamA/TamA family outer membrane protein [Acidobacteriota bacterium]
MACRVGWTAALALALSVTPVSRAQAQDVSHWVGLPVSDVRIVLAGRAVEDEQLNALLDIHRGDPLSMKAVRDTITHIMGMRRYLDVRVEATADGAGVRVDVTLFPLRDLQRIVFRGSLGLSETTLLGVVTERFGATPPVGRGIDIARTLEDFYAGEGYLRAVVKPVPFGDVEAGAGDLVFEVTAGARARLRTVRFSGSPADVVDALRQQLNLREGAEYQPAALKRQLDAYAAGLRKAGYFQAKVVSDSNINSSRDAVDLAVTVTRGLLVSLVFAGDPLPPAVQAELVPIEREALVDQDLLEDSEGRIKEYWKARGYGDASAKVTVSESNDRLKVEFTIRRGPLYRVAEDVTITGTAAVAQSVLKPFIKIVRGQPFVRGQLDADLEALKTVYRQLGYASVGINPSLVVSGSTAGERAVTITVAVNEGPCRTVRSITFAGRDQLSETALRAVLTLREGGPYYQPVIDEDRDRLETEYLNQGFRRAHVRVDPPPADTGADVPVRFVIQEGPKVIVDRILVVGNQRVSEATIRRELEIRPGEPLGDERVRQSQRKLAALGLFRRVTISELQHGQEGRSDVLVTVEESAAMTLGYGGGVEFQKVETNEFAPRAFVEIGRRNLWGKNRSVNLFSRVSFRRHGTITAADPLATPVTITATNLEYRVIGSYREPRFLNTRADLQVSAVLEKASRTSFRYRRRSARIDIGERLASGWSLLGQYSFERNEIFDDQINAIDRPLIDRLFPQVRLSILSASAVRDTRDDALDPGKGKLVSASGDLALRQIGSEVGFAKLFGQAFIYRQLPTSRRIVLAAGARLGLGTGFRRTVKVLDAGGQPVLDSDGQPTYQSVRDLPANERFFAGGDTTVRGFQLDRLGRPDTFDRDGTPKGGHAEIILNSELRMALWRDLGVAAFVDCGNVFSEVTDLSLTHLRSSAGFGIRYKSLVGPLRVDVGFKLGALQSFGTFSEHRLALHISIGQAF